MKTSSQQGSGPKAKPMFADLIQNGKKMGDISEYTALTILLLCCLSIPCSVFWFNPRYLTSTTGYADGGDMYSHIAEALHLKELLKNSYFNPWKMNFWYDKATLGYPMFTAYHPLPCFLTAFTMLLFERLISPLLVFRLLFILILTLTPFSWYISGKSFGFTKLHSTCLALLTFSIHSWRMFGLEMDAYAEYGLYTQSYGFLLLPLTVSSIFNVIWQGQTKEKSNTAILLLSTTLLSHFFFGLYACILSGVLVITYIIEHASSLDIRDFLHTLWRLSYLHIKALALISWWIIGCLVSYSYVGGLPWRNESEDGYRFAFLIQQFWKGKFFDNGRIMPWFTLLVVFGFGLALVTVIHDRTKYMLLHPISRMFSIWILCTCVITLLLFLGRTTFGMIYNIIPFHKEMECVKYLSGVHFCGLLLASCALTQLILWSSNIVGSVIIGSVIRIPSSVITNNNMPCKTDLSDAASVTFTRRLLKIDLLLKFTMDFILPRIFKLVRGLFLALAVLGLLLHQSHTMASKVTLLEINPSFQSAMVTLHNGPFEGRILTHRSLGTAGPWDLAFIPKLSKKPVLMTYSRGYHDSLSVYYLESMNFNAARAEQFKALLSLYNVHYLISSGIDLDETFVKECHIKHIKNIDDIGIYQLMFGMNDYGYFGFVNIPGYIQGDLKAMREAVLETLDIYIANKVLLINPSKFRHNGRNYVSITVTEKPFLHNIFASDRKDDVLVTWKVNDKDMESQEVINGIIRSTSNKWIYSQVIEEKSYPTQYHAIVQVAEKRKESNEDDYILLKVTYHPFWKSYYFPVEEDFSLDQFNLQLFPIPKGKVYTKIRHVTPNLMAINVPAGRYCIVFTYRYPGILKIFACLCIAVYIYMITTLFRKYDNVLLNTIIENKPSVDEDGLAKTWKVPGKYRAHSAIAKVRFGHETEKSVNKISRSTSVPAMEKCNMLGNIESDTLEDWKSQGVKESRSQDELVKNTKSKSVNEEDRRISATLLPSEIDQIDSVWLTSVKSSRDNVSACGKTNSHEILVTNNNPENEVVLCREFPSNLKGERKVLTNHKTDNIQMLLKKFEQIDPVTEYADITDSSAIKTAHLEQVISQHSNERIEQLSETIEQLSETIEQSNDIIEQSNEIIEQSNEIIEQLNEGIEHPNERIAHPNEINEQSNESHEQQNESHKQENERIENDDNPKTYKGRREGIVDFVNPNELTYLERFRRLSQWY